MRRVINVVSICVASLILAFIAKVSLPGWTEFQITGTQWSIVFSYTPNWLAFWAILALGVLITLRMLLKAEIHDRTRVFIHRALGMVGVLLCSVMLLALALTSTLPPNSRELKGAYGKYLKNPTDENLKAFQDTADRVNRPIHALQFLSLVGGIALPIAYGLRLRKRFRAQSSKNAPLPSSD